MYKNELEKIDTPNKAYLLGLFYSDGNVSLNQSHCRISLHEKDIQLLKDIKESFTFFNFYKENSKDQYVLHKSSVKLRLDLIANGCFPQKSKIMVRDLLRVPIIDSNLLPHFVRGMFDGDGGCHLNMSKNKTQKRVYIYSSSDVILKDIQQHLLNAEIETIIMRTGQRNLFKLEIRTNSYHKFFDYLYVDSFLRMERKIQLFKIIIEKTDFFVKKDTVPCKFCNSVNTVHDGFYKYKTNKHPRILCRDCKQRHIVKITAPVNSNVNSGEDELLES